ncbi:hypothetical protein ACS7SF_12250 [Ralstonia sp. 25C]|uniref:hypothetical protein n=1 Tax=Ralstonia sp. 25C TaxID=3447363 RepID=UPI003F74BEAA
MKRPRSRNLGDEQIADIAAILDGWRGKLSWDGLVETVASRTGQQYTRQALHRHERIRLAFTVRKRALSGQNEEEPKEAESPELKIALDRITRLEAENQRLQAENQGLLEQFARWAYNADTRNLTKEFLDNPLPPVDRARSDRPRAGNKKRSSRS